MRTLESGSDGFASHARMLVASLATRVTRPGSERAFCTKQNSSENELRRYNNGTRRYEILLYKEFVLSLLPNHYVRPGLQEMLVSTSMDYTHCSLFLLALSLIDVAPNRFHLCSFTHICIHTSYCFNVWTCLNTAHIPMEEAPIQPRPR